MAAKGQILSEAFLVLFGRASWCDLWKFIFILGFGELILSGKITMIEFFYIPENIVLFVVCMAIGGLIGALTWACMMKDDSETGKTAAWDGKYIASTLATAIIAPLITNVLYGMVMQAAGWADMFPSDGYCFVLILATFAIARFVLLALNKGLKKTFAQLKSDVDAVNEGVQTVTGKDAATLISEGAAVLEEKKQ